MDMAGFNSRRGRRPFRPCGRRGFGRAERGRISMTGKDRVWLAVELRENGNPHRISHVYTDEDEAYRQADSLIENMDEDGIENAEDRVSVIRRRLK